MEVKTLGQGVEAKAKATIFCPRGFLEVEDTSRTPSLQ